MSDITRIKCPDEERLDFLFNAVGRDFLRYEQLTFGYMDAACEEYYGGMWDFYSLSNGGFYMALVHDTPLKLQWAENAFVGTMSSDAAGIAVSLFVQNRFACEADSERYGTYFYSLREYAIDHDEAPSIFGFID